MACGGSVRCRQDICIASRLTGRGPGSVKLDEAACIGECGFAGQDVREGIWGGAGTGPPSPCLYFHDYPPHSSSAIADCHPRVTPAALYVLTFLYPSGSSALVSRISGKFVRKKQDGRPTLTSHGRKRFPPASAHSIVLPGGERNNRQL